MGGAGQPREWAAVVVNYFSGPLLGECLEALGADRSAGPPEIVVVDNGSEPGAMAALQVAHPGVTVLRPGANLGYARAANLGIAATTAPIVAVFNPDALLVAGSAAHVLEAFADPTVGIVGPQIVNPDGSVYPSARTAPGPAIALGHAALGALVPTNRYTTRYRQLDQDPNVARDVDWVSGAALWFRREVLDAAGGWDERFFLFLEDVDVCRVVRGEGRRVRYVPAARVTHAVGTSRAAAPMRSLVLHHRSAYRYVDKWWTGARRGALPLAAGFLTVRAGFAIGAAALHRGNRPARPEPSVSTG